MPWFMFIYVGPGCLVWRGGVVPPSLGKFYFPALVVFFMSARKKGVNGCKSEDGILDYYRGGVVPPSPGKLHLALLSCPLGKRASTGANPKTAN
jgi:hypothetical protein